jgi:heparan-alpha-glucosaminide N-acetyltransferase
MAELATSSTTLAPQTSQAPVIRAAAPARLVSLDIYRGFAMLLMASEGLGIPQAARNFKDSGVWQFLAYQADHAPWTGCALWDLIQPSFMFMVGVSMPYSIAARRAKGDSFNSLFLHALWRSFLLIILGVFLRSADMKQTNYTFTDVLDQIGFGYTFLFLLAFTKPKTQIIAVLAILIGWWTAFALYPLPPADFDYASVGVPKDWQHLTGFAQHWDKNTNLAHYFDKWFLNLFPREKPWLFNPGGYETLNFIPALATMILGLLAGELLRSDADAFKKFKMLAAIGIAGLIVGLILDATGVAPVVKRIWSPGWVVFSSGWTFTLLAAFYFIVDLRGYQRWAFPLLVVGMNSIAMYLMAHWWPKFIAGSFKTHFGPDVFEIAGKPYAPILQASAVLFVMWLVCWWMYRRKIFLKI